MLVNSSGRYKKQKPSGSEAFIASVGTHFHEISPLPTEQGAVLLRLILDTIFFPHLLERSPKERATFGEGETRYELTNNRPKCRSAIALRLYLKAEIAYSFVTYKHLGSLK